MGTRSGRVLQRAGVEGTGCYGAALTRYLRRHDITVLEVNRPDRAARRRQGKTDTIDATAAAHAVLSARTTTTAKTADGSVEMLLMFKLARASAVKSRTQAIDQLKAVIVNADPALRETLTGLTSTALIRHCAALPPGTPTDVVSATAYTLRRLAQRIQALTSEARDLELQITATVTAHRPAAAATPRHRTRQRRRPAHHRRRQPRPDDQRSLLRRTVRRQSPRSVLRKDPTTSTQPRR
jgi:transposase